MERIAALPLATKLMLGGGVLLLLDLFLTWQNVKIAYGPTVHVTSGLDGWDLKGALLGLLVLALLVIVILRETSLDLSPDVPWSRITLALGIAIFVIAVLKNLIDSYSTWASYFGVLLAAVVAYGAYKDWSVAPDYVVYDDDGPEPPSRWSDAPREPSEDLRPTSSRQHESQKW